MTYTARHTGMILHETGRRYLEDQGRQDRSIRLTGRQKSHDRGGKARPYADVGKGKLNIGL